MSLWTRHGFDYTPPDPKFHEVRESILLIPEEIAQDSASRYWEHLNQFVGSGLHRRWLRHLAER